MVAVANNVRKDTSNWVMIVQHNVLSVQLKLIKMKKANGSANHVNIFSYTYYWKCIRVLQS